MTVRWAVRYGNETNKQK